MSPVTGKRIQQELQELTETINNESKQQPPPIRPQHPNFEQMLTQTLDEVYQMLLDKNRRYGDSALNPVRLFSRADPIEQIKVRLDDKVSRLARGEHDDLEDVEIDLLGYLVLLRIARKMAAPMRANGSTH